MENELQDSEMPLGPCHIYSDALPSPKSPAEKGVAPPQFAITSPGDGTTNKTSVHSSKQSRPTSRRRAADPEIMKKVEDIVHQIVRSLENNDDKVSITLRCQKRPSLSPTARSSMSPARKQYTLSFPGETPEEAWRFSMAGLVETICSRTSSMLTCSPAVVLRILELIHEALVNDVVVSKRNIYYKDPELFKSQKVVDRYVDILSYTFGIQRAALNVTAAAKGLVAGSFTTTFHDSTTQTYDGAVNAMLIDNVDDIRSIDISNVMWILVVEKESTFRTLDASKIHETSGAGKGIILTVSLSDTSAEPSSENPLGQRLPRCLNPSLPAPLVHLLASTALNIRLAHENANLRCPTIRWLGVKSGDLDLRAWKTATSDDEGDGIQGLLRLSKRDRKKAVKMLGQEICEELGVERQWRRELQVMLMLNVKVEMEILSQRDGGIERWVEERLCEEMLSERS
ncbi:MAG: hypothetical protein Q9176_003668 [Flavoplaca citrina]